MSPTARPPEGSRPSPALRAARLLVLNALRRDGQATRAALREATGLANAAFASAVDDLRRDDLLALANGLEAPSGAGRPAEVFQLNPRGRFAVGVKVMERRVEAVLTDLSTSVINQEGVDMPDSSPASVVTATAQAVETLLARERVPRERLLGVGLAMPGVINAQAGVAVHVPPFNWTQVPLGALLQARLGCPAWLDNNANTFATAQHLFGHGRGLENLIAVTIGRGIGAGLVIGGRVARGRDGGTGEIGHTVVNAAEADPHGMGRLCYCGKRGCLEAHAGEPAIKAALLQAHPTYAASDDPILSALQDGVETAHALCRQAGQLIGAALGNAVNLLNPQLVVIAGEGVRLGPPILEPLVERLRESTFNGLGTGLPIIIDPWGDDAWGRGAASLAVQSVFE